MIIETPTIQPSYRAMKVSRPGVLELVERPTPRMQDPHLFANFLQRSVMGEVVIDHEIVTRHLPKGLCHIHPWRKLARAP